MRTAWLALVGVCIALPAAAHDFWIQPGRFWLSPGVATPVSLQVGHGANRQLWDADIRKVTAVRSRGPNGSVNLDGVIQQGGVGRIMFSAPGVYVVSLETGHSQSDLPAVRFNDYLKVEGLTPAIAFRRLNDQTDTPGREIYSRRAKALIRVGAGPLAATTHVTTPLGMTLEIVPERNVYAVPSGQPLPFRIYYEGRPLAGALVKLTNLGADAEPAATQTSNRAGRVAFTLPRRGNWQLNVVWTKPLSGNPAADFDTTFSSLTFGFETAPGS